MDPGVRAPIASLCVSMSIPSQSSSVIHSPNNNSQDEIISDEEARKRRELLARRPSYRKILNDLSDVEKDLKVEIVESTESEANSSDSGIPSGTPLGDTSGALTSSLTSSDGVNYSAVIAPGLNPLSVMNGLGTDNINLSGFVGPGGGPILQYVHPTQEQSNNPAQIIVSVKSDLLGLKPVTGSPLSLAGPSSGVATASAFVNQGLMPGYSPTTTRYSPPTTSPLPTASLPTASYSKSSSSDRDINGPPDDSTRKRQVRLLKNREAAKECRRKKKEYVKCLENRVAVLENQNKALIEELKTLKELYCRKGD